MTIKQKLFNKLVFTQHETLSLSALSSSKMFKISLHLYSSALLLKVIFLKHVKKDKADPFILLLPSHQNGLSCHKEIWYW